MKRFVIAFVLLVVVIWLVRLVSPLHKSDYDYITEPMRAHDNCSYGSIGAEEFQALLADRMRRSTSLAGSAANKTEAEIASAVQESVRAELDQADSGERQIVRIHARMRGLGAYHEFEDSGSFGIPAAFGMHYVMQLSEPRWFKPSADFLGITLRPLLEGKSDRFSDVRVSVRRHRWSLWSFPGSSRFSRMRFFACPNIPSFLKP